MALHLIDSCHVSSLRNIIKVIVLGLVMLTLLNVSSATCLRTSKYEGCINCIISNKLKLMSYETLQSNYSNLYSCNEEKGSVTFISAYVLTLPFNPSIISVIY